jgi:hypothetical protein
MTGAHDAPGGTGIDRTDARPFVDNRGLLARLLDWLDQRRIRPSWLPDEQLRALREVVLADHRILGHNHLARAMTERYLALLQDDYSRRSHLSPRAFAQQVGLDPEVVAHSRPADLLGPDTVRDD